MKTDNRGDGSTICASFALVRVVEATSLHFTPPAHPTLPSDPCQYFLSIFFRECFECPSLVAGDENKGEAVRPLLILSALINRYGSASTMIKKRKLPACTTPNWKLTSMLWLLGSPPPGKVTVTVEL